jgi:hypothetical protein
VVDARAGFQRRQAQVQFDTTLSDERSEPCPIGFGQTGHRMVAGLLHL